MQDPLTSFLMTDEGFTDLSNYPVDIFSLVYIYLKYNIMYRYYWAENLVVKPDFYCTILVFLSKVCYLLENVHSSPNSVS